MFEWEENTFLGLKALYQRAITRPRERRAAAVRACLKDHRQRLFVLAHLMAERPLRFFETSERVLCDGDRIFLPPEVSLGPSIAANVAFYETKTLLGSLALRLRWKVGPIPKDWMLHSPAIAHRFRELETLFESERLNDLMGPILRSQSQEGRFEEDAVAQADTQLSSAELEQPLTEIEGQGQLDLELEVDKGDDGVGADMPVHTFEKTETLEEHTGLSRKTDSEDELREHEEALREVKMNRVFRSKDRPQSIYRADALIEASFSTKESPDRQGIPYPEWDYKRRDFREDWCWVQESNITRCEPGWALEKESKHRALILDLKKKMAQQATQSLKVRRQALGDEFDLDALIEREVDLRSSRTPTDNLYIERRKRLHDVSALILMDRSFSTDGYLGGERVLDIIQETIFCAGEVLDSIVEEFGVAAFSSDTRQRCRFDWIKPFDTTWGVAKHRLGSLHAEGYTRIGPALRHAHGVLEECRGDRRVVILVTDGRPCDYDRYEGTYGIRDVKKAIEEGSQRGLATYAFAIESRAKEFFPALFTPDHFYIVPSPSHLTISLCALFARLRSHV